MVSNIEPGRPKVGVPPLTRDAFEDNFQAAKEEIEGLDTRVIALETGGSGVTSFEGRDGVVTATSGDYDISEIANAGNLASLDTVDTAQIDALAITTAEIEARAVTPAKVEITTPIDINGRTLADADHNKQFRCTGTGTVTIPSSLTNGFICQLINRSAGSVTIAGSGLTPDGDLTLGDDHFATIAKDASTSALVRVTG